jgi:hypothetical protein
MDFKWYNPYEEFNETTIDLIPKSDYETSGVTLIWSTVLLTCHVQHNVKSLFWLTPNFELFTSNDSRDLGCQPSMKSVTRACVLKRGMVEDSHIQVLENG